MSIQQTKCNNCGANLEKQEDNRFYCPHCKASYVITDEVNNTYITNNENIVKNFYGDVAVKEELDKGKIDNYFFRAYDYYFSGDFSNAKEYVMKVLTKQPDNIEANILNNVLSRVKGTNGRYSYVNLGFDKFLPILKKWITDKSYEHTSKNFERLIYDRLSESGYEYIMEADKNKFYYYIDLAKELGLKLIEITEMMNIVPELKELEDYIVNMISDLRRYVEKCNNRKEQEQSDNKKHKTKKIIYSSLFMVSIITFIIIAILLKNKLYSSLMVIPAGIIGCIFYKYLKEN